KLVQELRNGLRPEENPDQYLAQWREVSNSLAPMDSLQLLQAMTNSADASSRFIHLRLAGPEEGIFYVVFNSNLGGQMSVSQPVSIGDREFYDVWTAFPMRSARETGKSTSTQGSWIHTTNFRIHSRISPPTNIDGETELTLSSRRSGQRTIILQLSRQLK